LPDSDSLLDSLLVDTTEGVATVILNRPDAYNAIDEDMLDRLPVILGELAADPAVRCVAITGTGDRAFCAGGDISSLGDAEVPDTDALIDRLESWAQASVLLHEMPKPTVAIVNGTAAGAGMSLALACDLRIASDTARFITAFVKLSMSGDFGGSYFLTRLVGPSKARELYYLGRTVKSEEALALGLVNFVEPAAKLAGAAHAITSQLAAIPRTTIRNMKKNLNAAENQSIADVVRLEAKSMIETAMSDETRAAAKAFFDKK